MSTRLGKPAVRKSLLEDLEQQQQPDPAPAPHESEGGATVDTEMESPSLKRDRESEGEGEQEIVAQNVEVAPSDEEKEAESGNASESKESDDAGEQPRKKSKAEKPVNSTKKDRKKSISPPRNKKQSDLVVVDSNKESKVIFICSGVDKAVHDILGGLVSKKSNGFRITRDIDEASCVIIPDDVECAGDDVNVLIAAMKDGIRFVKSGIVYASLDSGNKWLTESDATLESQFAFESAQRMQDAIKDAFANKNVFFPPNESKNARKQEGYMRLVKLAGGSVVPSIRNADVCLQVLANGNRMSPKLSSPKDKASGDEEKVSEGGDIKEWSKRYPNVQIRTIQWFARQMISI